MRNTPSPYNQSQHNHLLAHLLCGSWHAEPRPTQRVECTRGRSTASHATCAGDTCGRRETWWSGGPHLCAAGGRSRAAQHTTDPLDRRLHTVQRITSHGSVPTQHSVTVHRTTAACVSLRERRERCPPGCNADRAGGWGGARRTRRRTWWWWRQPPVDWTALGAESPVPHVPTAHCPWRWGAQALARLVPEADDHRMTTTHPPHLNPLACARLLCVVAPHRAHRVNACPSGAPPAVALAARTDAPVARCTCRTRL